VVFSDDTELHDTVLGSETLAQSALCGEASARRQKIEGRGQKERKLTVQAF